MSIRDIRLADGTEANKVNPPVESLLLAIAGVVPTLAGTAAAWLIAPEPFAGLTIIWSAAILCFLAGVRRGLSFRQSGGPTLEEVATFILTFTLGVAALVVPWAPIAVGLSLIGYVLVGISDVVAARRAEAPPYFAGLRPVQMVAAVVALAALFVRVA
jgi:hypothetical protein